MKWKTFLELHSTLAPDEEIACTLWTMPDVYKKSGEEHPEITITDEIAYEVLRRMDSSDCTWDALEFHLEDVLRDLNLI